MFQTKVVEKIKTHILFSIIFFFRKPHRLSDNVEKYCRAQQVKNDNILLAESTPDTYSYKHTLRICNKFCFSCAMTVTRTRPSVKLNVHFLNFYTVVVQKYVQWRSHDMFTSRASRRGDLKVRFTAQFELKFKLLYTFRKRVRKECAQDIVS